MPGAVGTAAIDFEVDADHARAGVSPPWRYRVRRLSREASPDQRQVAMISGTRARRTVTTRSLP